MFKNYSDYINQLLSCSKCPKMKGKPVSGSLEKNVKIISIGQAPGIHEERFGKPFSYTAGKTLFKWLSNIDISEEDYRANVNMSAVCRCFPGKEKSGDRKPNSEEILNCKIYLKYEIEYHRPALIIPIGKLAIDQLIDNKKYKLEDVVGKVFIKELYGVSFSYIPLPHPSGLNVWNNTPVGKECLKTALLEIQKFWNSNISMKK